jgi:hypothetical protein
MPFAIAYIAIKDWWEDNALVDGSRKGPSSPLSISSLFTPNEQNL